MEEKGRSPFVEYKYLTRFIRLFVGLILFVLAGAMNLRSELGLSPWNAFHQGLSLVSGLSIGRVTQVVGIIIIVIDLIMREPIGFGTVFNMIVVGEALDFFLESGLLPVSDSLVLRWIMLLGSIVVVAFGTYLYMSARMGAGPRDSMMVGFAKRITSVSVGMIRSMIEVGVLVAGWLMGGVIGIGTVCYAVLSGPIMQMFFRLFSYDVHSVHSENMLETIRIWSGTVIPQDQGE
jgi:uncharacterized membrane protein YczE